MLRTPTRPNNGNQRENQVCPPRPDRPARPVGREGSMGHNNTLTGNGNVVRRLF